MDLHLEQHRDLPLHVRLPVHFAPPEVPPMKVYDAASIRNVAIVGHGGCGKTQLVSALLFAAGLFLIGAGWHRIHRAQGVLVTDGPYAWVRHPQYSGLFLITIGLLVQWPTIITIATWPILIAVYYRLALREEREAQAAFGDAYRTYKARTPMFIPRLQADRAAAPRWSAR